MIKNHDINGNNNIDLKKIIRYLWDIKYTIIIFSLFFSIIAYTYSTFQPKQFLTYAILEKPNVIEFQKFNRLITRVVGDKKSGKDVKQLFSDSLEIGIYFDDFLNSLLSITNFKKFLIAYPEYQISSKTLIKENINKWLYIERFIKKENNISLAKIFLNHDEDLSLTAHIMLNKYVKFMKTIKIDKLIDSKISILNSELQANEAAIPKIFKKKEESIKNSLTLLELDKDLFLFEHKRRLNNTIFAFQQALNIANNLDLKEPQKQEDVEEVDSDIIVSFGGKRELYNEGIKVLTTQIENHNKELKNLNKNETYNKIVSAIESKQAFLELPYYLQNEDNPEYQAIKDKNTLIRAEINFFKNFYEVYKWDVILENAQKSNKIYPKKVIFTVLGFFFGFFFSLIFMWFRTANILK